MHRCLSLGVLLIALPLSAQTIRPHQSAFQVAAGTAHDAESEAASVALWERIDQARSRLAGAVFAGAAMDFTYPVAFVDGSERTRYTAVFVDQTSGDGATDYTCGTRALDGHRGTDFGTWPYPWQAMDDESAVVVAAAPGTIVLIEDGAPDRNCSLAPAAQNALAVEHADGSVALYGSLKAGSLQGRAVGDAVAAGDVLGVIGSSGASTGPHVHFEVRDANSLTVDPYAGECNPGPSAWITQEPYTDPELVTVRTGRAEPVVAACPTTEDVVTDATEFVPGDAITFSSFFRDETQGLSSSHTVLTPTGGVAASWVQDMVEPYFAISYWWRGFTLPTEAAAGTWIYRVSYEGRTLERTFDVAPVVTRGTAPSGLTVQAPSPNPSRGDATLALSLDTAQPLAVSLFDALGRRLVEVHDGPLAAGAHALPLALGGLAPGVYVVRVSAGDYRGAFPVTVTR